MSPRRDDSGSGDASLGAALGVALGAAGVGLAVVAGLAAQGRQGKERGDMAKHRVSEVLGPLWPIAAGLLRRVGESVLRRRAGSGQPHKGIDLFAPAGAEVRAATYGRVLRVIDGREGESESRRRAGLFVDVRGLDGKVYRYLHLGSALVREGEPVRAGQVLGTVSPAGQSGVEHSEPHVHFEIRAADWDRTAGDYGEPVDPLRVLPPRERMA